MQDAYSIEWERVTNFSFYISKSTAIGLVLDLMAEEGYGEVSVKINGDYDGNVVYSITGFANNLSMVRRIHQRIVEKGIEAEVVY